MPTSPTQRSLALLRKEHCEAGIVEKWIPQIKRKQDLWGCIDIVAMHPERGVLFVQVTSADNMAARRKKLKESNAVRMAIEHYGTGVVELHGWGKFGKAGKRKLWQCRREAL